MKNGTIRKAVTPARTIIGLIIIAVPFTIYLVGTYFYRVGDTMASTPSAIRTLAGVNREFGEPFGVAVKGADVYVSDGDQGKIWKISANGIVSLFTQNLDTPSGIAFDPNGNLIIADAGSNTVRQVDSSGGVSTLAGTENKRGFADGEASSALFNGPVGVAVSDDGKIYVADTYNDRIRVIESGMVSTMAGGEKGFADGAAAKFDTP
jgi:sugar lactone lactonase YvrE